jgi:disulfide bond formation protein DsbB
VLYWTVLLGSCAVVTILATLIANRPMLAAIGVSVLAGLTTGLYGARTSALWILGTVMVIVCSLPVTIVAAMLTERWSEKWRASRSDDVPGAP